MNTDQFYWTKSRYPLSAIQLQC